jgi:inosose dehydratase
MSERRQQPLPVGCGQITWAPYRQADPDAWTEERILAEIAEAGYDGAPAGAHDTRSNMETIELYARHGLRPAPGYLGGRLWLAEARDALVEEAKRDSAFLREAGCDALYVAAGGGYVAANGRSRGEASGKVTPEDGLTDAEMATFAETLNAIATATLAEGVRSCFHNHVGTPIETRAEFERLLALCDPAVVFLGPDTGHIAWAGDDPVAFCRDYAARIKTIHLKDIDPAVATRGRAAGWDYGEFSRHGIWQEPGSGPTDFPTILSDLEAAGFDGWLIVETDVTQLPSALDSARVSREYLRSIGV